MNSNAVQTVLTVVAGALTLATTVLLSMGCTTDVAGQLQCIASHAPTWLAPYMGIAAAVIGLLKIVIGALSGKLMVPTVPVSTSGAPGTVHPDDVVKSPSQ